MALVRELDAEELDTSGVYIVGTPEIHEKIELIPEPQLVPKEPEVAIVVPVVSGTCLDWMNQAGITDIPNATILINRESGCNPFAQNPNSSAYGIPQALPPTKMASAGPDYMTNPVTQLIWMQSYVNARYGGWAGAVAFSTKNKWY